ncbi:MAG: hypothetical protein ACLQVD_01035 [Capsulimonadaceae bacterium]
MKGSTLNLEYVPHEAEVRRCRVRLAVNSCKIAFATVSVCLLLIVDDPSSLGLNHLTTLLALLTLPWVPLAILAQRFFAAGRMSELVANRGHKLVADSEGFTSILPDSHSYVPWRSIDSVTCIRGDIYLWLKDGGGHYVCACAFVESSERDSTLAVLKSLHARSRVSVASVRANLMV